MNSAFKLANLLPNAFPYIKPWFPANYSGEAFRVACNRTWIILASIPFFRIGGFPEDMISLSFGLGEYKVDIQCSKPGTAILKFTAPVCESQKTQKYKEQSEFPIIYELYGGEYTTNFKQLTSCFVGSMPQPQPLDLEVEIGYVNNRTWHILKREKDPKKGIAVGVMIFGSDIQDNDVEVVVNDTMNLINGTYFNNSLIYEKRDLIFRDNRPICDQLLCKKTKLTIKTRKPKSQFDLVLFLTVTIPAALLLLGLVVYKVLVH